MNCTFLLAKVCLLGALVVAPSLALAQPKSRDVKVREDRQEVEEDGYWIYNDLPAGLEVARLSKRPLMVVFRCIP